MGWLQRQSIQMGRTETLLSARLAVRVKGAMNLYFLHMLIPFSAQKYNDAHVHRRERATSAQSVAMQTQSLEVCQEFFEEPETFIRLQSPSKGTCKGG